MDTDYSENPLYAELKYFCRKIQEAYNEFKEDLTPYRDDRFYRLVSCLNTMADATPRCALILWLSLFGFVRCVNEILATHTWKNIF